MGAEGPPREPAPSSSCCGPLTRPTLARCLRSSPSPCRPPTESEKAKQIPRLDRLARALTVQGATLAVVWRDGGNVFTADGGEVHQDDPDDPMRTAMRQDIGVFAELDRRMVVKRLRDGRAAKAASGRKAVGAYAYGFHRDGEGRERDAAPNPMEQAAQARILELRAKGMSYRAIGAQLDTEGLPRAEPRSGAP
ncbi:recombinase family protein [Streptomyces griseoincarnatus]|uniref:recombinase family protein n=1 Tax=Streptomyces sp. SMS_SU21 TaxID=2069440 RepID=UPI001CD9FCF9|nr:recombinase family protein [Streptomyces sp. SMS_SU21]MCA2204056.1 recombinase family protein [Streptomyces sp. SMS_SU21]